MAVLGRGVRVPGRHDVRDAAQPAVRLVPDRDHLSAFTITVVFAIFAVGTIITLLLEGRVAGRFGRRGAMLGGVATMMVAAGLLAVWKDLPGLLIGRLLTGVAIGLAAGVAIAYLIELRLRAIRTRPRRRPEHRHRGERGRTRHRPAGRRLPRAVGAVPADLALPGHGRARGGGPDRRGGRARDGYACSARSSAEQGGPARRVAGLSWA